MDLAVCGVGNNKPFLSASSVWKSSWFWSGKLQTAAPSDLVVGRDVKYYSIRSSVSQLYLTPLTLEARSASKTNQPTPGAQMKRGKKPRICWWWSVSRDCLHACAPRGWLLQCGHCVGFLGCAALGVLGLHKNEYQRNEYATSDSTKPAIYQHGCALTINC